MSAEMSAVGIEKGRPAFAYEKVSELLQGAKDNKTRKEYRAHLRKFPTMVLTNGLGQTLAYYFSKGDAHRGIYLGLQCWMQRIPQTFGGIGEGSLIEAVLKMDQSKYRLATKQIVTLVGWMSRFADGMLGKDGELIGDSDGKEGA